jgi:hypothetical protein
LKHRLVHRWIWHLYTQVQYLVIRIIGVQGSLAQRPFQPIQVVGYWLDSPQTQEALKLGIWWLIQRTTSKRSIVETTSGH